MIDLWNRLSPGGSGTLLPDRAAPRLATAALPLLDAAIACAVAAGRPLFAANRDVAPTADPVETLWQAATTLREHRGDIDVAVLSSSGLDGCEAHVLFAAVEGVAPQLLQQSRGWSAGDWNAAVDRLADRGLVGVDGTATRVGRDLRNSFERRTDELAMAPYAALGDERIEALLRLLQPAPERIASSGEIEYPNPMGLPQVDASA
jgi:hypothetical protein